MLARKRAAHVEHVAVAVGREAACLDRVDREHHAADRLLGACDLVGGHLGEVLGLQQLPVRHGEAGVDLDLALLRLVLEPREQRLLDARGAGLAACAARPRPAAAASPSAGRDSPRLRKNILERLVEQQRVLVLLHEHGVQRPVEVFAVADARGSTASSASRTAPGPTGMPAARSARAKYTMFSASRLGSRQAGLRLPRPRPPPSLRRPQFSAQAVDQLLRLRALDAGDVVLVLEQHAERVRHRRRDRARRRRARSARSPSRASRRRPAT